MQRERRACAANGRSPPRKTRATSSANAAAMTQDQRPRVQAQSRRRSAARRAPASCCSAARRRATSGCARSLHGCVYRCDSSVRREHQCRRSSTRSRRTARWRRGTAPPARGTASGGLRRNETVSSARPRDTRQRKLFSSRPSMFGERLEDLVARARRSVSSRGRSGRSPHPGQIRRPSGTVRARRAGPRTGRDHGCLPAPALCNIRAPIHRSFQ